MRTSTILLLTTCVLLLATATQAQTIRRVNNNPGVTGVNVYTTAQAAHDAAAANDILIIEPSVTTYGDLTLTKPLKIYGNGYFLDTNTELKVDNRSSLIGEVRFHAGSGGSEIYGIDTGSASVNNVSNITIQRCKIGNISILGGTIINVSNIIISQNFIANSISGSIGISGYVISNILITNNFLRMIDYSTNPGTYNNWIVQNNTFLNSLGVTAASKLINSVFENTIVRLKF